MGVVLRLGISAWNGFWGPSFGAEYDALGFHLAAVEYSNDLVLHHFVIGHIYSYLLGAVYFITTDSLFLGSMMSVVAWYLSALILMRIMRDLDINDIDQCKAMLIYALLPSSLMLTSITLREPYQMLLVNIAAYAVLTIYLRGSKIHWLILFVAIVGMSSLHGAMLAAGIFVFLTAALLLWAFQGEGGFSVNRTIILLPVIAVCWYFGYTLLSNIYFSLDTGLDVAVQGYQDGIASYSNPALTLKENAPSAPRATYQSGVEISSLLDLIITSPILLFKYLFEPMPWRISALVDIVALLENVLRFWLIWRALKYFTDIANDKRRFVVFIFLSYLAIETIWSMGVSNWGTAMRHHLPSFGLLVVAAFAYKGISANWFIRLKRRDRLFI